MKKCFLFPLLLCFLCCIMVKAKKYTVNEIPIVHLQDVRRYVCNPDSILSIEAVDVIDSALYALEQQTGIQVLVVAVKEILGGGCFDFAYQLGQHNGVGQKEADNGLVVLLVTEERCIQFATGYGLEGSLPDAVCKRIQIHYMNEAFGEEDWDTGMVKGIQAICKQLDGASIPMDYVDELDDWAEETLVLFLTLFLFFAMLLKILLMKLWDFLHSKCPSCHKYGLLLYNKQIVEKKRFYSVEVVYYRCKHCKHIVSRHRKRFDSDSSRVHGGSSNRESYKSNSSEGGRYGGGSFGGGGAGSKF